MICGPEDSLTGSTAEVRVRDIYPRRPPDRVLGRPAGCLDRNSLETLDALST